MIIVLFSRETAEQEEALEVLRALSDLINQTVGDALSDLLMVEAILACQQQSFAQWNTSYTDLPSRQEKVKVFLSLEARVLLHLISLYYI